MLSNIELILMRFIKQKPSYAYEINSLIERRKLRHWVKIGGATVYQALDRLCKKRLLEYKIEKEGNMPERKRYYITEEGNRLLLSSVKEILQNIQPYYFDFSIGLACRRFLDKKEFKELIKIRLEKLSEFVDSFNEIFEKTRELYPTKRLLIREYLLSHYKLEQQFLKKLLQEENGD